MQQYDILREDISQLDTSGTFDSSDPNQHLFFVSFDGTRNDWDSTDPNTVHTNPDILQKLVPNSDNVAEGVNPLLTFVVFSAEYDKYTDHHD